MARDDMRGIFYIVLKDIRTYYLKPPALSWGIVFPLTWILAFYLRNQQNFADLAPGLIAMTILFSTTAAEAVVINFELRIGSLERLLLAPVSMPAILFGKVLGGGVFGLLMTAIITIGSCILLGLTPNIPVLILIILVSLLVYSSLGAMLCIMVKEVYEAQTLLNLPRFLMIFLSGVAFPVEAMPRYLQFFARLMPLTYTVEGLKHAFSTDAEKFPVDSIVLVLFLIVFVIVALKFLRRKFEQQ